MSKANFSDLWKKEDWLAVWIGFIVIGLGILSVLTGWFDMAVVNFKSWTAGEEAASTPLLTQLGQKIFWFRTLVTFSGLAALFAIGIKGTPAVMASLISGIEPILNPTLVAIFYGEMLGPLSLVGAAIVMCGILYYNIKKAAS